MKTNKSRLFFSAGALALCGGLALQGCSSDDSSGGTTGGSGGKGGSGGGTSTGGKGGTGTGGTSTGGKGGTGTGGTSTGTGGTAGRGGTGGTAGRGGTGGIGVAGDNGTAGDIGEAGASADVIHPTTTECTTFCADEALTCGTPTLMTYTWPTLAACLTACGAMTEGGVSKLPAGPTAGDTFACRRWHLNAAAASAGANASTHCPHTGVPSKDMAGAAGPCVGAEN